MQEQNHNPAQAGTQADTHVNTIALPAPTAWPFVLAFGLALLATALVTTPAIGVLGGVLTVAACVGWFREVLPHEKHENVHLEPYALNVQSVRTSVARIEVTASHRARLPVETPSIRAGIDGGIAGGVAMTGLALLYGWLGYHSIWYPINLLAGAAIPGWAAYTTAQLVVFHMDGFLIASVIHVVSCLLVGLLYGAMLPMFPRRPILMGGFIAPFLWSGLLYSSINIVNPLLNSRIDWGWFVASQVAFGLVAGFFVNLHTNIRTRQYLPFAARMGLEMPGLMGESNQKNDSAGSGKL